MAVYWIRLYKQQGTNISFQFLSYLQFIITSPFCIAPGLRLKIQKKKIGVVKHFKLGALEEMQRENNSRGKRNLGEGGRGDHHFVFQASPFRLCSKSNITAKTEERRKAEA